MVSSSTISFYDGDACRYPVVRACARRQGWRLVRPQKPPTKEGTGAHQCRALRNHHQREMDQSNVLWCDLSSPLTDFFALIRPWQCLNHFPGMANIARKTRLAYHLQAMARKFPIDYNFFPETFALPRDFTAFRSHFSAGGGGGSGGIGRGTGLRSRHTWIIKPDCGAKGHGIFLTRDLSEVQAALQRHGSSPYVAQRYLRNPLLIDAKKFDLRIYVLVTRCDPALRVYLFRDGLCRLCTEDYCSPDTGNMACLTDRCAHLTNYSVNKLSDKFVRADSGRDEAGEQDDVPVNGADCEGSMGSKRSIAWLLSWLREKKGVAAVNRLWCEIGDVCAKTVLSIEPALRREYRATFGSCEGGSRCFEILGVDIMIDDSLSPHLIEVNHLPSFGTDSPLDESIKARVVGQAMRVVSARADDKKTYEKAQRRRSRSRLVSLQRPALRGQGCSMRAPGPCENGNPDEDEEGGERVMADLEKRDDIDILTKGSSNALVPPTAESILTSIYKEHAPEKLGRIKKILVKYRGYEEWLIVKAREKYCNQAEDIIESVDEESQGDVVNSGEKIMRPTDPNFQSHQGHGSSSDQDLVAEEELLPDYDRIYPPQKHNQRCLPVPPYQAMVNSAFEEDARQLERLTVPLQQSRGGYHSTCDPDATTRFVPVYTPPIFAAHDTNRASWIRGDLHLRPTAGPAKIRHPPTKKQIERADRLSRGYHADEDMASGTSLRGNGSFATSRLDAFEMADRHVSDLCKKRWDLVRRVRQELDCAKERRKMNDDRFRRSRLGVTVRSFNFLGSPNAAADRNEVVARVDLDHLRQRRLLPDSTGTTTPLFGISGAGRRRLGMSKRRKMTLVGRK